jgi:hypothetical protein
MNYWIILFSLLSLFQIATSYFIHIDANEEQCFFDRVTSGTKMGLMFEVAEGGFLDIDVKVCQFKIVSKNCVQRHNFGPDLGGGSFL